MCLADLVELQFQILISTGDINSKPHRTLVDAIATIADLELQVRELRAQLAEAERVLIEDEPVRDTEVVQ